MRTFWYTYTKSLGLNDKESNKLLYKSVKYCAIRLLQTVYEASYNETELSKTSLYMARLSMNLLNDVGFATTYMLGIPLRGYQSV